MISEVRTVFLIERSDETRSLVAAFLDGSGMVQVVGSARDPVNAVPAIRESAPDVVVIDRFPPSDFIGYGFRLVVHAATVPDRTPVELGRAGVYAIVFKEVGMLSELVDAVLGVAESANGDRRRQPARSVQRHHQGPR